MHAISSSCTVYKNETLISKNYTSPVLRDAHRYTHVFMTIMDKNNFADETFLAKAARCAKV